MHVSDEGWLVGSPSRQALEDAREDRRRRDEQYGKGIFIANEDSRWVGSLAETFLAHWLRSEGVEFEHNGGVDSLPDFRIDGVGIGVKTQIIRVPFRKDLWVVVPDQHRDREHETVLVFAAYEAPVNVLTIAGVCSADRFYAKARFVPTGGMIGPRTKATNPVWQAKAHELISMGVWRSWIGLRSVAA